jgi:LysM repeat protein
VLEGGQAPSRLAQQAVYRRRRLVAVALHVLATQVVVLLANAVVARAAGGGTPVPAAGTPSPAVHVVQPGDTLWSIARQLDPAADVRLTVDRLADLNGGAPLTVGQRLVLP